MTECKEHEREDCDACADETRLEDEYDELYCALQALVAQLIMSELPIERVRAIIVQTRANLASLGLTRAVELTPELGGIVFRLVRGLVDDTKERAKVRQEGQGNG